MATRTPNQQLKELVAESGLTYAALAKAVRAVAAECGTSLRTNKSTVEHWIAGVTPQGDTGRYLAVALSRRLGRLLTPADFGLAEPEEDDSIGLALGADPIDALLPMWRFELDRRRFLTSSAYSVAAVYETLGDHRTAAEQYSRAAGARPAGTYARIVALDLVAGAEMQLKRGQIEQACATWNRPWTTWTAYGPSAPVRRSPACAATSPASAPAAYAARPNWTNAPSTSSPAPDVSYSCLADRARSRADRRVRWFTKRHRLPQDR
ncbi:hypothetical protein [Streptomyces nigrescens]|uniref:Uncharacterized protein n=1 Tax=Streptomyces nigrescens TaxID=1920 RepID=A0ABY7IXC6_STRNI|nr:MULTISPECIES: hypothetical protein [Streptomyces]MCX5451416.1 hypothetical protein [Streptomyces libani]WAU02181.1 hypothetical protein STRNI_000156 [Streptomyces nigrescens]